MAMGDLAGWISGIGSLCAVVVALFGFRVVSSQRRADRRTAERATAYELLASILEISNNIKVIEQHFAKQRNDITVRLPREGELKFKVVNPMIGLSSEGESRMPPGSTEVMVAAGAVDLWNDVLLLFARNRSITNLMKEYREIWERAILKMPTPNAFNGTIGSVSADDDVFANIRINLIQLDAIVTSLVEQISDSSSIVDRITKEIGPIFKIYFGEPFMQIGDTTNDDSSNK